VTSRAVSRAVKVSAASNEVAACEEFKILQVHFGSSVSLRELESLALVIAGCAHIPHPPREARRKFPMLIEWFRRWWHIVCPWLPLVQLRDTRNVPIDARRELTEMNCHRLKIPLHPK
jgi:hypothetical protein